MKVVNMVWAIGTLLFYCPAVQQQGNSLTQQKRRRHIDRSMIGEPTNFVHTAHVGSGDYCNGMNSEISIQNQMQSKGGYGDGDLPVNARM